MTIYLKIIYMFAGGFFSPTGTKQWQLRNEMKLRNIFWQIFYVFYMDYFWVFLA